MGIVVAFAPPMDEVPQVVRMKWTELYVYGASGHGKVVADVCFSRGVDVTGFVDDDPEAVGRQLLGIGVIGNRDALLQRMGGAGGQVAVALGIGSNRQRENVAAWCVRQGLLLPALTHSSAVVAASARLGLGTIAMAGVVVNPDSAVGDGVILNTACVVEHDNAIRDFAHLSANATTGGNVSIGARSHLGLNSAVLPNVRVGDDVVVGAGAVVVRDIGDGVVLVGIPARPLASGRRRPPSSEPPKT